MKTSLFKFVYFKIKFQIVILSNTRVFNSHKSFIKSFISHIDSRKKMNDLKDEDIFTFADFIRMLWTVLEKIDLKPVFGAPDAPFRGWFKIIMFSLKNPFIHFILISL